MIARRTVLAAGIGAGLAGLILGCDSPSAPAPPARATLSGRFDSRARLGQQVAWKVLTPEDRSADGLPLVVFLHGKGGDHTMVDYWADGLKTYAREGGTALAVAGVDAGNTYYHPRASGEDSGAMVLEEFLPLLAEQGLDTARLALAGISMGGYGSLRLAGILGRSGVRAVTVASPALWREDASYAPGAFDSAADHHEHNVFGEQPGLAGIPLRIDCGLADPFLAATRDYLQGFSPQPEHSFTAGRHNVEYWRGLVSAQLNLLGRALT